MKNFSIFAFLLAALSLLMMTSCDSGKYPGFKKSSTGVYYKIHTPDNEDTLIVTQGKIVSVKMVYGTEDTAFLFNSADMPQPVLFPILEPSYEGGFYESMLLFKRNDSATCVLLADSFFLKTVNQPSLPEGVNPGDDVVIEIRILEVQTQEEVEAAEAARMAALQEGEQGRIDAYVAENNITVSPTETGVIFIEIEPGKGRHPGDEDWVSVHYTVRNLDGDKLFSTYDRTEEPMNFEMGGRFENVGFQEAIKLMKEGGKAEVLVPSSMAFGAQGAGQIVPPHSTLYHEIELVDVMNYDEWDRKQSDMQAAKLMDKLKKEEDEKATIAKYIADNNMTPAHEFPSGIVYVEDVKGTGPIPGPGSKVKVHYTGKLLDGSIFDSSVDRGQPFEFTLGKGQVIKGWDKGIAIMHVGSKGTLIIPFEQGYGARGSGNRIPPYSTLVFEVELLEIVPQ